MTKKPFIIGKIVFPKGRKYYFLLEEEGTYRGVCGRVTNFKSGYSGLNSAFGNSNCATFLKYLRNVNCNLVQGK